MVQADPLASSLVDPLSDPLSDPLRSGAAAAPSYPWPTGHGPVQARANRELRGDAPDVAAAGVGGQGSALPHFAALQASFGGHDLSGVKAHVGGAARTASDALGAQAYATGNDVAFAKSPDMFTAAHEAAHVVQQRSGVQLKGGVGQPGDSYERHADAVADRVVRGESAEPLLGEVGSAAGAQSGSVQGRFDAPVQLSDDDDLPEDELLGDELLEDELLEDELLVEDADIAASVPDPLAPDEQQAADEQAAEDQKKAEAARAAEVARGAQAAKKKKKRDKSSRGTGAGSERLATKMVKHKDGEFDQDGNYQSGTSGDGKFHRDKVKNQGKTQKRGLLKKQHAKKHLQDVKRKGSIMGALGNEKRMALDGFAHGKDTGAFAGAESETLTEEYTDKKGTKYKRASRKDRAGAGAQASTLSSTVKKDASGNVIEESKAGATAETFAGVQSGASASTYKSKYGVGAQTDASASAGVGGKVAAGASHKKELASGVEGYAGTQATAGGFAGTKAQAEAGASTSGLSAEAHGSASAMMGAEVDASAGAEAGIRAGGFDLVGARASGKGRAMAGVEGSASGSAKVGLIEGAQMGGQADVFAGAKVSGDATAGVSLGGVDADVGAEGTAMAGAEADASGSAAIGLTGAKLVGEASAFAGAKAEGSASFDIGAGGLNLAVVTVEGEASAGIGAEIGGNITAYMGKLAAGAKAAATYGVGCGAGGKVEADLFFPLRLTLAKLAENGVISSGDPNVLAWQGLKWFWENEKGGSGSDSVQMKSSPGAASALLQSGKSVTDMVGGLPQEQAAALLDAKERATGLMEGAHEFATNTADNALSAGEAMQSSFLNALKGTFSAVASLHQGALANLEDITTSAFAEAGNLARSLHAFGAQALADMRGLMSVNPLELMEMDWNGAIDAIIAKVHAFVEMVQAQIAALILRAQEAAEAMAQKTIAFMSSPFVSLVGTVGGILGSFGHALSSLGLDMVSELKEKFGFAEEGIPVPALGGALILPVAVTPTLAKAEGPLSDVKNFFGESARAGASEAVQAIITGFSSVVMGDVPGKIFALSEKVEPVVMGAVRAATDPLLGVAQGVRDTIGWAIEKALAAIQAAKKAAEAVAAAAKKFFSGW